MIRTPVSEALHAALRDRPGLGDVLLASVLTAAVLDLGPSVRRQLWLTIPEPEAVAEFRRVLEVCEDAARRAGDPLLAADCRIALADLRAAMAENP
jgi:hypothetical protein